MKIGLYASMFGKDDPPTLKTVESFIEWAYALRLDVIDFRSDKGFDSHGGDYVKQIKLQCFKRGLSIGYVASSGHFVGTDEELQAKLEQARKDTDLAVALGTPMIRLFCGQPLEDAEQRRREIDCFQRASDYAASKGIAVGLQNHPSTGDDIVRIMEETDRDNFTFLLDTGQWLGSPGRNKGVPEPGGHDIYKYMEQTAKYAAHVRAKFYKIDSGQEEWLDYPRIIDILRNAGFNGTLGIVFEGQGVNDCDDKTVIKLAAEQLRGLVGRD
ncbi:MAG: TIM barrel protein [Candidatus Latescibacteria bacterium]|nr:TIM barrel protein [Candidatus Latescibacterota bacterium]